MNSISVRLTFTDDKLYDNFIEPRKVNGDLPTLVLRLLTAYATNDELAYQIDQFLDKDSEPDVCAARDAIMRAVARLNGVDAAVSQELEAMNEGTTTSEDEEFDLVSGEPDLVSEEPDTFVGLPKEWTDNSPKPVALEASQSAMSQTVQSQSNMGATPVDNNNVVLQSINALTSQVATLTSAITMLVQGGGISVAQQGVRIDAPVSTSVNVENPVENVENLASPVENSVENVDTGFAQSEKQEEPVESSVENVDTSEESSEDAYEIPDFMNDMLAGL